MNYSLTTAVKQTERYVIDVSSVKLIFHAFLSSQEMAPCQDGGHHTFKEWSDVPHGNASSLHELAQRNFQEEDRNSTEEYKQHVGNEKDS